MPKELRRRSSADAEEAGGAKVDITLKASESGFGGELKLKDIPLVIPAWLRGWVVSCLPFKPHRRFLLRLSLAPGPIRRHHITFRSVVESRLIVMNDSSFSQVSLLSGARFIFRRPDVVISREHAKGGTCVLREARTGARIEGITVRVS
jgi:hypothetical protein